jgi:hypothetical protein
MNYDKSAKLSRGIWESSYFTPQEILNNQLTMTKKRKKQKNRGGRKQLKRKDGIKIIEAEVQAFMKEITGRDEVMIFSQVEQQILYIFYFRLSNPVAEEGQYVSGQDLRNMGRLLHKRLHEPIVKHKDRWYSIRELNMLFCYHQVMNIGLISMERRLELWEYLGDISKFELTQDDFVDAVFLHFYKAISVCSDVRNKVYTLALTHTHYKRGNLKLHFNSRMGIFHAVKKKINIEGQYRMAYRVIMPRINYPRYLNYNIKEFKQYHDADLDEVPVYIQAHALKRMKERLDLLDDEALNYNLFQILINFKHFYDVREYILIPYQLYDVKVGYFFCQIVDNQFIIRTFLFITHFSTPEGSKLKEICGLGRKDVPYWKIDRLSTFMNVDAAQYPRLTEMFEKAGCGDLFKLQSEEFTAEAMQNANLDGLRDFVMRGKNELGEPVMEEDEKI